MPIQKEKAGLQGKYVAGINTRKSTNKYSVEQEHKWMPLPKVNLHKRKVTT